jgi:2-oxoglutarate dehydrogenase E1 component
MLQNDMKQRLTWEDFHGPNLGYIQELYELYVNDPESLDQEFREMFEELGWFSHRKSTAAAKCSKNCFGC